MQMYEIFRLGREGRRKKRYLLVKFIDLFCLVFLCNFVTLNNKTIVIE